MFCVSPASFAADKNGDVNWNDYGGGPGDPLFSPLKQINRSNVSQLQVAWTYPTGDAGGYTYNPIIVDGMMYVMAQNGSLIALDATTGKQIWVHRDAFPPGTRMHGINYWESSDRSDRRLIFPINNQLQEINARTGDSILTFGNNGWVDLRLFHGRDPATITRIQSPAAGRVFENLIIVSEASGEEYGSPPGDVRAYDVVSGKLAWIFHVIPRPGEPGSETWPADALKTAAGGGAWGEMTLDEKRGILYVPTGAGVYNFYGASRKGANLFGDCLLALNARTGKLIWYFQNIHHDIWDDDSPAGPKLLTIRHDGKDVDVVAQATKTGLVFVFDRDTGKPIWPIVEKPVPKSEMPGEESWPTQPFPTQPPPFARQTFTEKDVSPYMNPQEHAKWVARVHDAINEGVYTPPSTHESIQMPGNHGGANWGMVSMDPAGAALFVETLNFPAILKLEPAPPPPYGGARGNSSPAQQGRSVFQQNCQLCHGADLQGQPPVIPPLVGVTSRLSTDQIKTIVRGGRATMPSFSSLSDADLNALLLYLANPVVAAAEEPPPPAPPSIPPAAPGEVRYWSGYGLVATKENLGIIDPPWSTLTAYDLNKGTIRWQIPLGDSPELAQKGITNTGGPNIGITAGIVTTGGGVIFSAGTIDQKLRAIDERNGRTLWQTALPDISAAMPSVYAVGGREYLVICATGGVLGAVPPASTPRQPAYVVYALPQENSSSSR